MSAPARWLPTWALHRVAALVLFGVGFALVTGRPDLALLILPVGAGAAWSWAGRAPAREPIVRTHVPGLADQRSPVRATIALGGIRGTQALVVQLPRHLRGDLPARAVLAPDPAPRRFTLPVDTTVWGRHDLGRVSMRAMTADGLLVSSLARSRVGDVRVLPVATALPTPELPARAAGRVGAHRTRRPGDGSELLDIREFRPGDRIRRIDWRVSARRGQLHVRHTAIDADADLVLCLDTRWDVGPDLSAEPPDDADTSQWSLATSVTAAASLAQAYLRLGDRVAMVDLNLPARSVPPGTGPRHLLRMRWQLAGLTPDRNLRSRVAPAHLVPRGAVTIVLSPFLDPQIDGLVAALARRQRDVVAVNVLPPPMLPTTRRLRASTRLILAERDQRLAQLARLGVLVTPWDPALLGLLLRRRMHLQRRRLA
jgi:uncharacterized protein (DUF58 family)